MTGHDAAHEHGLGGTWACSTALPSCLGKPGLEPGGRTQPPSKQAARSPARRIYAAPFPLQAVFSPGKRCSDNLRLQIQNLGGSLATENRQKIFFSFFPSCVQGMFVLFFHQT